MSQTPIRHAASAARERRTEVIHFRLTASEYQDLESEAHLAKSIHAYARNLIVGRRRTPLLNQHLGTTLNEVTAARTELLEISHNHPHVDALLREVVAQLQRAELRLATLREALTS